MGSTIIPTKTAWMRAELFFSFVKKDLISYIWKNPRLAMQFLLVDEAHGKPETLPELDNVQVKFLPKNTTPKIQPLDVGIIAAMERLYRKRHIENAMSLLDCDTENI